MTTMEEQLESIITEVQIEKMSEQDFRKAIFKQLISINAKVDPMYETFSGLTSFNKIITWLMKLLGVIGAALVGLYAIIEFFKRLGK